MDLESLCKSLWLKLYKSISLEYVDQVDTLHVGRYWSWPQGYPGGSWWYSIKLKTNIYKHAKYQHEPFRHLHIQEV